MTHHGLAYTPSRHSRSGAPHACRATPSNPRHASHRPPSGEGGPSRAPPSHPNHHPLHRSRRDVPLRSTPPPPHPGGISPRFYGYLMLFHGPAMAAHELRGGPDPRSLLRAQYERETDRWHPSSSQFSELDKEMKDLAYGLWGPLERREDGRVWWCGAPIRSRRFPISLPGEIGEFDRIGQRAFREDRGRREVGGGLGVDVGHGGLGSRDRGVGRSWVPEGYAEELAAGCSRRSNGRHRAGHRAARQHPDLIDSDDDFDDYPGRYSGGERRFSGIDHSDDDFHDFLGRVRHEDRPSRGNVLDKSEEEYPARHRPGRHRGIFGGSGIHEVSEDPDSFPGHIGYHGPASRSTAATFGSSLGGYSRGGPARGSAVEARLPSPPVSRFGRRHRSLTPPSHANGRRTPF